MAFDGFVISNLVHELKSKLIGGRINKISQPEKDELILTIKNYDTYKLDISVSAGLPLMYITEDTKPAPLTAPSFCMLLRKHLNSARILDIIQPEMERVVQIKIEHLNEMGDIKIKWLMIELMGKHSNIIFVDDEMKILDSIKHVSLLVSSVREVLPGRDYFIPKTTEKCDIHGVGAEEFASIVSSKPMDIVKAIYSSFTGFSPLIANDFVVRAGIDPSAHASALSSGDMAGLYEVINLYLEKCEKGEYEPVIVMQDDSATEFSCFNLANYDESYKIKHYDSISEVLVAFYAMKDVKSRINQKSAALRKTISNAIERASKKYDLQFNQLKSTEKRDKYRIYGEMITTYGYSAKDGDKELKCLNYYDNTEITVPLDDTIPVMANAKKYFDRYAKLKRTYEAVSEHIKETEEELYHLKSIQNSMEIALYESDLTEIKKELADYGYTKKVSSGKGKKDKKEKVTSKPLHYITPDGYDIYVGKNNYQNDELTFKFANGGDWWFHAKKIPGSHVIVKSKGEDELPDKVYEWAGKLAAYYSSDKTSNKVEIDYLRRKDVKKPNGSKPGFVVYYTNYSLVSDSDISELKLVE